MRVGSRRGKGGIVQEENSQPVILYDSIIRIVIFFFLTNTGNSFSSSFYPPFNFCKIRIPMPPNYQSTRTVCTDSVFGNALLIIVTVTLGFWGLRSRMKPCNFVRVLLIG